MMGSILGEDCVLNNDDYLIISNPYDDRIAYLIRESNCLPLHTIMRGFIKLIIMDLKSAEQKNNLALIDDKKVSIGSDKSPNIASKLNELIASHISKSKLTYKTFNQFEIGYRSHGDKGFIDWLDLTFLAQPLI